MLGREASLGVKERPPSLGEKRGIMLGREPSSLGEKLGPCWEESLPTMVGMYHAGYVPPVYMPSLYIPEYTDVYTRPGYVLHAQRR